MSRTKDQQRRFRRALRQNRRISRQLGGGSADFVPARRTYGNYQITWEQLKLADQADPVLDRMPDEQRQSLFNQVAEDPKAAITVLKELLAQSPNSRTLRNWLTTAYSATGDQKSTEHEARITYELHPHYLFAKIAWAQICLQNGQVDAIPKIFDGKFDLKALHPDRDVFHITEFLGFAGVMAEYFLRTDRQGEGESLYRAMKDMAPGHPMTQQMRRVISGLHALRRFEKSDYRTELANSIRAQRAQGFGWRWDGLDDWTTDGIFNQLQDLGIDTNAERFPRQAELAGGFNALRQDWSRQILDERRTGFWEDFPFLAVPVLWNRLASSLICPELIEQRLYRALEADENAQPLPDVNGIPSVVHAALALARYLQGFAPSERPDRYQQVIAGGFYDYGGCLMRVIEKHGPKHPDAAVEIADMMSECHQQPESFQSDLARALAAAGRSDQAKARALGNVRRFPEDIWVRVGAGDVFEKIGDHDEAIRLWREALAMAQDSTDRRVVVDRMKELCDRTGRQIELEEIVRMYPDLDSGISPQPEAPKDSKTFMELESPEPLTRTPKLGRNDPCFCGSGKKYKKCCMP